MLRIGKFYKYLSTAMLRGFTTAAVCYVFTAQLQHIFGIYPKTRSNLPILKLLFVNTNKLKIMMLLN